MSSGEKASQSSNIQRGEMMDLAFIGGVFKNEKDIALKNGIKGVHYAANAFQWNIIEGLEHWHGAPLEIINVPFVGCYPNQHRNLYFRKESWSHCDKANDACVGFLNIWGVKNIFRAKGTADQVVKWIKSRSSREKVVLAYSAHMPFLWALRAVKRIAPETTTCLVVPDLPNYMNMSKEKKPFYRLFKALDNRMIGNLMKYVDLFVLLTEPMAEKINIGDRRYVVIEGMVNGKDIKPFVPPSSSKKTILYTGTLNYKYGIGELLKSFQNIDDEDFELWICGQGEAEEEIKARALIDKRIKWFGMVSRDHALELQHQALVLINPRPPLGEYVKYSFPSKNLEYLLSGRPLIAYKLPGIPDEYNKYIFYVDPYKETGLTETIITLCNKPAEELHEMGLAARKYVLEEKNNITQSLKIYNLIKKNEKIFQ